MSPALIALANSTSSSSGVRAGMGHPLQWIPNRPPSRIAVNFELAVNSERRPARVFWHLGRSASGDGRLPHRRTQLVRGRPHWASAARSARLSGERRRQRVRVAGAEARSQWLRGVAEVIARDYEGLV